MFALHRFCSLTIIIILLEFLLVTISAGYETGSNTYIQTLQREWRRQDAQIEKHDSKAKPRAFQTGDKDAQCSNQSSYS